MGENGRMAGMKGRLGRQAGKRAGGRAGRAGQAACSNQLLTHSLPPSPTAPSQPHCSLPAPLTSGAIWDVRLAVVPHQLPVSVHHHQGVEVRGAGALEEADCMGGKGGQGRAGGAAWRGGIGEGRFGVAEQAHVCARLCDTRNCAPSGTAINGMGAAAAALTHWAAPR